MKINTIIIAGFMLSTPIFCQAAESVYCPSGTSYIHVGMSMGAVGAACGQPTSSQESRETPTQQIPVTQLIYNSISQGAPYAGYNQTYKIWSLPTPTNSTPVSLEVDIVNNQVAKIIMNGSSTNQVSVCSTPIQVGAAIGDVYSACGSPSVQNQTFINQPVSTREKPIEWIYNLGPYQPAIHLTFVNGTLQSIN